MIEIEEAAPEAKKVSLFKTAVEALNALDAETQIIETGEREELCELFNLIAVDCGIDPWAITDMVKVSQVNGGIGNAAANGQSGLVAKANK